MSQDIETDRDVAGRASLADDAPRVESFREFITHPLTSIALGLFAVAILAAPFYVQSLERGLLDNDRWISLCGAFGR